MFIFSFIEASLCMTHGDQHQRIDVALTVNVFAFRNDGRCWIGLACRRRRRRLFICRRNGNRRSCTSCRRRRFALGLCFDGAKPSRKHEESEKRGVTHGKSPESGA
jgi:hypothetical protein